jgi:hypothetical protein
VKLVAKFCSDWDFYIVFGFFALAVEGKRPPHCNSKFSYFTWRCCNKFCLVLYYYLFGLTAVPFTAVVCLNNGGNIVIWLSWNVT